MSLFGREFHKGDGVERGRGKGNRVVWALGRDSVGGGC